MFGLKRRPRPGAEKRQKIVVPEFLIELYRQQTGLEVDTTNLNLAGKLTQTANTVRTFANHQIGMLNLPLSSTSASIDNNFSS